MKTLTNSIVTILALSGIGLASYAQDAPKTPLNCNNAIAQVEMNLCAKQQAETADKHLNSAYQKLQSRYTTDLRQADNSQINRVKQQYQQLINAQKTWIKLRDTTCEYERSRFEGGSIAPMIYHSCVAKLTDRRTADLQQ
jgi:uncharacterized protein YecT (DUF1311 family)